MRRRLWREADGGQAGLNLTAMIDVVFILITFFLLIFRSIGRENFPVAVPDEVAGAQAAKGPEAAVTVSVFRGEGGGAEYAVGESRCLGVDEVRLAVLAAGEREVLLRADGTLGWGDVGPVLAALSEAGVARVRLAALEGEGAP